MAREWHFFFKSDILVYMSDLKIDSLGYSVTFESNIA